MLTFLIILLFFALMIILSWRTRKVESVEQFLIGRRDFGHIQVCSGLFTLIGGGEFVTLTLLGYLFGWSAIALFAGYSLGFVLLAFLAPKLRAQASERQYISLPDYVHHNFGQLAGTIVFTVSFLAFFALLMLQFSAVGAVISPLTGLDRTVVIFGTGLVIIAYLVKSGFQAVMRTDVIQSIAMIILAPALLFAATQHANVSMDFSKGSEGMLPKEMWLSLVCTGALIAAASADVWQRAYAASSDRTARIGFLMGAGVFMIIGFVGIGFGVLAYSLALPDPNTAFVEILSNHLQPSLGFAVALLVLSALMSTADTEIFLLTGLIAHEQARWGGRSSITKLSTIRILLVIVAVASLVAAYYFSDLVAIYTWLLSALVTISPAIVGSLLIPTDKRTFIASTSAGIIAMVAGIGVDKLNFDNLYMTALPAAVVFIICSFVFKRS